MSLRSLFAVAALLLASACSSEGNRAEEPSTTLVFSFAEQDETKLELLARLARGFEAEHPGVRVFLHTLPHSTDAQRVFYLTSLSTRSSFVDVMKTDVIWTAEFAAAGLLRDLSGSRALAGKERFLPALLAQATYNGRLYGAPYYATFGTLFYRADLLRKHNLRPPRTLKELVAQARRVGKAEGVHGLLFQAADYEGLACVFFEIYACLGDPAQVEEGKVRLDPGITRDTLRFLHDAIREHGITPPEVLSHTEVESTESFASKEALFMRNWRGAHDTLARRLPSGAVGAAVMPASRGPLSGGFLLAVNSRTDVPELAEAFVAYMVRPANQRLLARGRGEGSALAAMYRGEPGRPPGLQGPAFSGYVIRPRSPYYFELSQVVTEETRAVLKGERGVDEGARRITTRAQEVSLTRRAAPGFPETSYMTRYRQ